MVSESRAIDSLAFFSFEKDWIIDLQYIIQHVEEEGIDVINKKQEDYEDVQTGNIVDATKEIKEAYPGIGNNNLNIKDVEVENEQTIS